MNQLKSVFYAYRHRYSPSAANFITLVFSSNVEADDFTRKLLLHGIIIRHLASFGLPECVRITIGTNKENEYFIDVLEKLVRKDKTFIKQENYGNNNQ